MKRQTANELSRLLAKRLAFVPSWAWQAPDFEITEEELMADLGFGRDECDDDWSDPGATANDNAKKVANDNAHGKR